ncbi:MAG: hypothetical protein LW835_03085 [Burkholderiaceae bacterium]|jgi:hypothetical protein|nr:hypothetical protein [Burkholderiaceae bacterium]
MTNSATELQRLVEAQLEVRDLLAELVELSRAKVHGHEESRQGLQLRALETVFGEAGFTAAEVAAALTGRMPRPALRAAFGDASAKSVGQALARLEEAGALRRVGTSRPRTYVVPTLQRAERRMRNAWTSLLPERHP